MTAARLFASLCHTQNFSWVIQHKYCQDNHWISQISTSTVMTISQKSTSTVMTIRKAQNNTITAYINTKAFHTQPPTIPLGITHRHLHTYTHTPSHACTHIHTHTHTHARTHTHIYIHPHTRTCTYTHTHVHKCTHTPLDETVVCGTDSHTPTVGQTKHNSNISTFSTVCSMFLKDI